MRIVLQYFDGCPHEQTMRGHLRTLIDEGLVAILEEEMIDTQEKAVARGFRGSPTLLVDGIDPFDDGSMQPGMSCRIYRTEQGPAGAPTLEQLRAAISEGTPRDIGSK
ncbi:MAG: thioredoxin family protein [Acidimicrobiia bacterium]